VKHRAPVRAFPVKLNRKRFNLTGKRSSDYRWWNEVPTSLMMAVVFLAVLKPF